MSNGKAQKIRFNNNSVVCVMTPTLNDQDNEKEDEQKKTYKNELFKSSRR